VKGRRAPQKSGNSRKKSGTRRSSTEGKSTNFEDGEGGVGAGKQTLTAKNPSCVLSLVGRAAKTEDGDSGEEPQGEGEVKTW